MFNQIGWGEIAVVLVLILIIVGPERLPGFIEDIRAAIYAARKAISNAKKELNGEFGEEFQEFSRPIAEVAKWQRRGPRALLTQALFDGDDEALDSFDPKKIMSGETAGAAYRRKEAQEAQETQDAQAPEARATPAAAAPAAPKPHPAQEVTRKEKATGSQEAAGFDWDDIM